MSESYEYDFVARFDAPLAIDDDVVDIASLHRILLRRTHRQFAPRPVSEGLVTLLTAAALSASSKSDFQQASIIRVLDPEKRAALAALIPRTGAQPPDRRRRPRRGAAVRPASPSR